MEVRGLPGFAGVAIGCVELTKGVMQMHERQLTVCAEVNEAHTKNDWNEDLKGHNQP